MHTAHIIPSSKDMRASVVPCMPGIQHFIRNDQTLQHPIRKTEVTSNEGRRRLGWRHPEGSRDQSWKNCIQLLPRWDPDRFLHGVFQGKIKGNLTLKSWPMYQGLNSFSDDKFPWRAADRFLGMTVSRWRGGGSGVSHLSKKNSHFSTLKKKHISKYNPNFLLLPKI